MVSSFSLPTDAPLILAFVSDLMFGSRIELAARKLGFRLRWIAAASDVTMAIEQGPERIPAEPIYGSGADLIDLVSAVRPALLVFDLGNDLVPWREWISLLKSSPATRRYPIVTYGAHVEGEMLVEARRRGADGALARSGFAADLPAILEKFARIPDIAALRSACNQPLSSLAQRGIELFNHGEYFEAHELLEAAWNEDPTPTRDLYRAILQIAVAYLQIERRNYNGAVKMFLRVRQWIEPLPNECCGVDVAALRRDANRVHDSLLAGGSHGIEQFDRSLFKPVKWKAVQ